MRGIIKLLPTAQGNCYKNKKTAHPLDRRSIAMRSHVYLS